MAMESSHPLMEAFQGEEFEEEEELEEDMVSCIATCSRIGILDL